MVPTEGASFSIMATEMPAVKREGGEELTSASLMHETGHPKLGLWDNPQGWIWGGGGRGVQDEGDTFIRVANSY